MTSPTRLLNLGAALALALSLTACDSFAPEAPTAAPEAHIAASAAPALAQAKAGPNKVALCHLTASDTNDYVPISVAAPAVNAHLTHGDVAIGDPVPGMLGFAFDEACRPFEDPTAAARQCVADAEALGLDVAGFNVVAGTDGNNNFGRPSGSKLICGFGGNDHADQVGAGVIFLGGEGDDNVHNENRGTFYGGPGNDAVGINYGFFDGGDGVDTAHLGNAGNGTTVNVEHVNN